VTRDQLPLIMSSLYPSNLGSSLLDEIFSLCTNNSLIAAVAHVWCSMLYQANLLVMAVKL
jgi:hypothetical protein